MIDYNDIINLPNHKSKNRKLMSNRHRAAQFMPFAALPEHFIVLKEAERLTDRFIELDENTKIDLNNKLLYISQNINLDLEVEITHFIKDLHKEGGTYLTDINTIKKLDSTHKNLTLKDKTIIYFENIIDIKIKDLDY